MMQLKIPPPIIGLLTAFLMWLANRFFPLTVWSSEGLRIAMWILICAGLAIELVSVALFLRARTTVNPVKPDNSSTLVVGGLYRFSRNPMYCGMLLLLTAYVLWLGNPLSILFVVFFVMYITEFQIKPEEVVLRRKFGESYAAYCRQVRRWI